MGHNCYCLSSRGTWFGHILLQVPKYCVFIAQYLEPACGNVGRGDGGGVKKLLDKMEVEEEPG